MGSPYKVKITVWGFPQQKTLYINSLYEEFNPSPIREAFHKAHNAIVGHNGVNKTCKRMKVAGFNGPEVKSFIRRLITECVSCQKSSFNNLKVKTMPFTTGSYNLWECLHIDTMGPFEEDRFGMKYILNIIDAFSRFVHLIPTKGVDAKSAMIALLQHVGLFGVPNYILTDNGTQYINEGITALVEKLGCRHITTTPYSKEENAIVERSNKESNRYMRPIVENKDCLKEWSIYVPLAQRIINSNEHESIGVAPSQIVFPNVDLNRMFPFEEQEPMHPSRLSDFVHQAHELQNKMIEIAQNNQRERDSRHVQKKMKLYENRRESPYKIGDFVLLTHPNGQPPQKWSYNKHGPFKIATIDNGIVTVTSVNGQEKQVNISRLVPFHYDSTTTNPEVIAAQEKDMFIVENILSHKEDGVGRGKQSYKFQVKWEGWDGPTDLTWEPMKHLKNNSIFHAYCKQNKLEKLIPEKYQT